MATTPQTTFRLDSHQTAIAFVVPEGLRTEINSLRRIHDRAFHKWPPHINLIYPFVDKTQLQAATSHLRNALRTQMSFNLNTNEVSFFQHGRFGTIFVKPSEDVEHEVCNLREALVSALGCDPGEGTRDGTFRPHLTLGRAGSGQVPIEKLLEKARKLETISWKGISLSVLRRLDSGEMEIVEELTIGADRDDESGREGDLSGHQSNWKQCFQWNAGVWTRNQASSHDSSIAQGQELQILTYNIMSDSIAPSSNLRFPAIIQGLRTAVSEVNARVLCLQEVDEDVLPLLLGDPFIITQFPFASHQPSSLLQSKRNLVILASEPFQYHTLAFPQLHKSALISIFGSVSTVVANVHLTSSLTNDAVRVKLLQMNTLHEFLKTINCQLLFVAGDFNLTTSSRTIEVALTQDKITLQTAVQLGQIVNESIWSDVYLDSPEYHEGLQSEYPGEHGATFDRLSNPLAALTQSPIENRPERYDRILNRRDDASKLNDFRIFGRPDKSNTCGSDHFGVSAVFSIYLPRTGVTSRLPTDSNLNVIEDNFDVDSLLVPLLPNDHDRAQRIQAIETLEKILKSSERTSNLILAPLGSYLMDTFFSNSDVDVLAIGDVPPQNFFDFAQSSLRALDRQGKANLQGAHLVNSLVSIIQVSVDRIEFDIQYCQAPELLRRYHQSSDKDIKGLVFDGAVITSMPTASLRSLNTFRDTVYLLNTVADISTYRVAHRFLSTFLRRRGLYSAKFGYLGGIHLSLLLNRVFKIIDQQKTTSKQASTATIIKTFFGYYSNFHWATESVVDPSLPPGLGTERLERDAVFIQAIHLPAARANVSSSCTKLSAKTLSTQFHLACSKIENGYWDWCLQSVESCFEEYLECYGAFILTKIDFWDVEQTSSSKFREVIGNIESRFPRLLTALGRTEGLDGRVWPARLCNRSEIFEFDYRQTEFSGHYLVGVTSVDQVISSSQKKVFSSKVISAMQEFEGMVKSGGTAQLENVFLSTRLVPRREVLGMDFVNDNRDIGQLGAMGAATRSPSVPINHSRETVNISPAKLSKAPGRVPLRPVQDIISRINWDSSFSANDFVIGYEDRFIGVKEIEFLRWKTELSDEEFIPMHRIVWVRKKDALGGQKVWDRPQRLDVVFGSGIGNGL